MSFLKFTMNLNLSVIFAICLVLVSFNIAKSETDQQLKNKGIETTWIKGKKYFCTESVDESYVCFSKKHKIEPKHYKSMAVAVYSYWHVFTVFKDGVDQCYIATKPVNVKDGDSRDPHIIVTYKKDGAIVTVFSSRKFQDNSTVEVSVDNLKINSLFVDNSLHETGVHYAWAYTSDQEKFMIKKMIEGFQMITKSFLKSGGKKTDKYSLLGFTKAYNHMKKLCS